MMKILTYMQVCSIIMFLIKIVIKRFLLMMTNKKTSEIYFLAARLMKA